jgi:hypothetical protein
MKPAFIEQGSIDLRGGTVLKTIGVEALQDRGLFAF